MIEHPPLNAVLIGTGMVSRTYVDAIGSLPGVELLGALAARPASAQGFVIEAGKTLGQVPEAFETFDAVLADRRVDFVILATPPDARSDYVTALAEARVPILMEKPVARSLEEAEALVETCEENDMPLGIMLQHRARPVVRVLSGIEGLGPLAAAEISVPWWRPQPYYDAPGRGTYARDGGGVLISQAIHTLDLALLLAGPVTEASALSATTALHRMEAEDFVAAGLRFDGGAVGQVFATTAAYPGRAETIRLHHENASVTLEGNALRIDWRDGRVEEHGDAATTGAGPDPMAFTSDWHAAVIADFADALREGRAPMVPGRSALAVHRLIDAIERAARTGRTVRLGT